MSIYLKTNICTVFNGSLTDGYCMYEEGGFFLDNAVISRNDDNQTLVQAKDTHAVIKMTLEEFEEKLMGTLKNGKTLLDLRHVSKTTDDARALAAQARAKGKTI